MDRFSANRDENTDATTPPGGEVRIGNEQNVCRCGGVRCSAALSERLTYRSASSIPRVKPLVLVPLVAVAVLAAGFLSFRQPKSVTKLENDHLLVKDEGIDPFELLGKCTTLECVSALHPRLKAAGAKFNYPHFFLAGWQKAGMYGCGYHDRHKYE